MSIARRVLTVIIGALMLFSSCVLIIFPNQGYILVAAILSLSLVLTGIRSLIYYFNMARHMVGGRMILYIGVLTLDIGFFTFTIISVSQVYLMLYLFGTHAFSGMIDILRAREAKKYGARSWRFRMASGIVNIVIAGACCVFIGNIRIAVYIYCAGLIYSGIFRIISAFRKTSVVYIQ